MLGLLNKLVKLVSVVVFLCSIFVSINVFADPALDAIRSKTPVAGEVATDKTKPILITRGFDLSLLENGSTAFYRESDRTLRIVLANGDVKQIVAGSKDVKLTPAAATTPIVPPTETLPNGAVRTNNPDGSYTIRDKDGVEKKYDKNAKEIEAARTGATDAANKGKSGGITDPGNIIRIFLIIVAAVIAIFMWVGVMIAATFILLTAQSFIFFFSLDVSSATWQQVSAQPASVLTAIANMLIIGSFVGVALGYLLDIAALKIKLNDFFIGMAIYTILINFSLPLVFTVIAIAKGIGDVALFAFTGNTEDPYGNMLAAFMDSFAYGSKTTEGITSGGVANIFGQAAGSGTAVLTTLGASIGNVDQGGDNSQTMSILLSYGVYLLVLIIVLIAMWKLAKVGAIRFVMLLFCIIVSPITLACGVSPFPALKKVAQMWLNAFVPLLLFYPGLILGFAITGSMVRSFNKATNTSLGGGKVAQTNLVETLSMALGQPISVNAQEGAGTGWGATIAQIIIPLFAAAALWKMIDFFAITGGPLSKIWDWTGGKVGKAAKWAGKEAAQMALPAAGKALDNSWLGQKITDSKFGARGKLTNEIKDLESQKNAETDSAKKLDLQAKIDKLNVQKQGITGSTVFGRTGMVGAAYVGANKEERALMRKDILRVGKDSIKPKALKDWQIGRLEKKEAREFDRALALADAGMYSAIPEKYKELKTMSKGELTLARQKDSDGISNIDRMRTDFVESVARVRSGRLGGAISVSEIPGLVSQMSKMRKKADGTYDVGDYGTSIFKLFDKYLEGDRTAVAELGANPAAMAVLKSMLPEMLAGNKDARTKVVRDFPGLFSPGLKMSDTERNRLKSLTSADFATLDIPSLSLEGKRYLRESTRFPQWCEQTKNMEKLHELDMALGGSYGAASSSATVRNFTDLAAQQANLPAGSAGYGVPSVETLENIVSPALVGTTAEIGTRVQKDSTTEVGRILDNYKAEYVGADLDQKLKSMGLNNDADVAALGIAGIGTLAELRAKPNLSERLNKLTLQKLGEVENIDKVVRELDANALANSNKLRLSTITPEAVNKLAAARLNSGIEKQTGISLTEGPTKDLIAGLAAGGQTDAVNKIAAATDLKSRMATIRAIMVENPAAITSAMANQYVSDLVANTELGRGMTPAAAEDFQRLNSSDPIEALKAALVFQESVVGTKNVASSKIAVTENIQGVAKFQETTGNQQVMLSAIRAAAVQLGGPGGNRERIAIAATVADMANNLTSNGPAGRLGLDAQGGAAVLFGMSPEQQFEYKERFAGIMNESMKLKREQDDLSEERRVLERQMVQETNIAKRTAQATQLTAIDVKLQAVPTSQAAIHQSTVSFMEDAMKSNPSLSTMSSAEITAQAKTNATKIAGLINTEDQGALNTLMAPSLSAEETRIKATEFATKTAGQFKELVNQSVELGIVRPTAQKAIQDQHVVIQNVQFAAGRNIANTNSDVEIKPVIRAAKVIAEAEQELSTIPVTDATAIATATAARDQAKAALEKVQKEYEQVKAFEALQRSGVAATDPRYAASYSRITQLEQKAATTGGVTDLEIAEKEAIKKQMVQQALVFEQAELNSRIKAVRDANSLDRLAQADIMVSSAEKAKTAAEKVKTRKEYDSFKANSITGTRVAASRVVRTERNIAAKVVAARPLRTP